MITLHGEAFTGPALPERVHACTGAWQAAQVAAYAYKNRLFRNHGQAMQPGTTSQCPTKPPLYVLKRNLGLVHVVSAHVSKLQLVVLLLSQLQMDFTRAEPV